MNTVQNIISKKRTQFTQGGDKQVRKHSRFVAANVLACMISMSLSLIFPDGEINTTEMFMITALWLNELLKE